MKRSWKRGLALCLSFVMTAGNLGSGMGYSFAAVPETGKTETRNATSSNAGSGNGSDTKATESNATMANALKRTLAQTKFSLADDFSSVQGPVWYYKYEDKDTKEFLELQRYDPGTPRWMDDQDKYLRVFQNGMMPGNKGDDVILEWVAPEDGLIQIAEDDGKISMETNRTDRDGVLLSIQQNENAIWPDTGTVSTEHNMKNTEFKPFYLRVAQGDTIHFRANGNKNFDNDRVFWCPVIQYLKDENVTMISDLEMKGRDTLTFTVSDELLSGDVRAQVTLSAIVNGAKAVSAEVLSAAAKDGAVTVKFKPVEASDNAVIQLLAGFDGDNRFITYSPSDFAAISNLTYYVDAVNGNDDNDGLSEENAWKSGSFQS